MNQRKAFTALFALFLLPLLASAQTTQTSCPNLSRNLSIGLVGNDVISLQNFLIAQNLLPQGDNTGYFGRLTKAAAIQFQTQQSLPTTGFVGPLTRAAIARACTGNQTVNQTTNQTTTVINPNGIGNFSATLTSGAAPLSVTFSYGNLDPNDAYNIDFGDNQADNAGGPLTMSCTTSTLCTGGSISHTYASAGVYAARLIKENRDYCDNKVPCDPPGASSVSVTITVTGTPSSSATINPSSLIQSSSGITLTGTDSDPHTLWVDVIKSSYSGPTDFFSLMNNGADETGACGSEGNISECGDPTTSSNGTWSEMVDVASGTYHVYVFDTSTHLLLASALFTKN